MLIPSWYTFTFVPVVMGEAADPEMVPLMVVEEDINPPSMEPQRLALVIEEGVATLAVLPLTPQLPLVALA
jgi:hypothetical protein